MKIALTVAGSDSCGGAGLQQDLKVFSSLGVYGVSVVTAITAQNTREIEKSYFLPPEMIESQLDALFSDIPIDAVKTGMLGGKGTVEVIYQKVKEFGIKNLVIDPVMRSTSGHQLLKNDALLTLKKLISLAKITTPNREEAEILSGIKIKNDEDIKKAAKKIGNCVITGGDSKGRDFLYFQGKFHEFESKVKIKEKIHGTGCAFSAAITANLAKGFSILEAVEQSKEFMDSVIARNFSLGRGFLLADTAGIKLGRSYQDIEKKRVIEDVSSAIEKFCDQKGIYKLIPEVGSNLALALPRAKTPKEVAGLTGRIVRVGKKAIPTGIIDFGGSSHVARVILAAMKFNPEKRAGMNIKFSEELLEICKKLNLKVAGFDRREEPLGVKTLDWGTKTAIGKPGKVPDIIYDRGGQGKEAMVRILGKDARRVVNISLKILKEMG